MAEVTLLSCIERIHCAALDPKEWSPALEMIADLVGGAGVTVLADDTNGGLIPLGTARTDDDSLALLLNRYSDPVSNPGLQLMMALPPGSLLLPQHLGGPDHPFYHSELYNEMYRAQGMIPGAATMLSSDGTAAVGFALNCPEAKGPLDRPEIVLLERLVPHLSIAVAVAMRLARLEAERSGLIAALDRLPTGAVLVDARGAVILANREAELLFAEADGLSVAAGRLRAARPAETAALTALVGSVNGSSEDPHAGGSLRLPRPSGRRALSLMVAPLRLADPTAGGAPAAIVFIDDPDRLPSALPFSLVRLYGLSPQEALLATHLCQGLTLNEAAEQMAIGRETARTYLKRIFDKTGTRRQSELLRLILRGLAALRDGADGGSR